MSGVRCALFVVRCVLIAVWRLVFAVGSWLLVVCYVMCVFAAVVA